MLSSVGDFESKKMHGAVILSDNCSSQYKSALSFHILQNLASKYNIKIIRVYGCAGHGKNEVDHVGGLSKVCIRTHVSQQNYILNADDCVRFLKGKFESKANPTYDIQEIPKDILQAERLNTKKYRYPTVVGSSQFHIMIFKPNSNILTVSNCVCACGNCLAMFGECSNFYQVKLPPSRIKKEKPPLKPLKNGNKTQKRNKAGKKITKKKKAVKLPTVTTINVTTAKN